MLFGNETATFLFKACWNKIFCAYYAFSASKTTYLSTSLKTALSVIDTTFICGAIQLFRERYLTICYILGSDLSTCLRQNKWTKRPQLQIILCRLYLLSLSFHLQDTGVITNFINTNEWQAEYTKSNWFNIINIQYRWIHLYHHFHDLHNQ